MSSESSESLFRPALVGSEGFVVSGGGDGEGEGELRGSRERVEPVIVGDDEEVFVDNKPGTCARIPHDRLGFRHNSE